MVNEPTQQRLLQRRENYKRRKEKEKGNELEKSCTNDIVDSNMPNQIFTAMNFSKHTFKEPMTTKQNEVRYILMTQHLVSDEKKIIYFYAYLRITIIYYCIGILSFCHKYSCIFILTTKS